MHQNWESAGLRDVVIGASDPFGVSGRFVITGENIRVPPRVILALGIALNELATNAVQYGAFSNETGFDMLADLGCDFVSTAATIDQSLRLIDAHVFDAATLDVNLNGTSSYPVAETLATRGVPFVFSTGYGAHVLRDEYRDRPILRKPFSYEQLAEMLTRLLS